MFRKYFSLHETAIANIYVYDTIGIIKLSISLHVYSMYVYII